MEKCWMKTRFGEAPFKDVKLYTFDFSGPKSAEDTAVMQYNLLLNADILQAHLDFETKKGHIVLVPPVAGFIGFDLKKVLKDLGIKFKLESEDTISYEYLLSRNNTF
jgi:hypothetical protein